MTARSIPQSKYPLVCSKATALACRASLEGRPLIAGNEIMFMPAGQPFAARHAAEARRRARDMRHNASVLNGPKAAASRLPDAEDLASATIIQQEFAENATSRLIWAGLDYAMANNSITTITGESRQGKTVSVKAWAEANNHGRSVYVVAPPLGGIKMLMRVIAGRIGANKNQSIIQLAESLHRAFNRNRILLVDEAHRLLPNDIRTVNPAHIELLRDLHDQTGCALAFIATERFTSRLKTGSYQFEQLIGRIGMPIRLPRRAGVKDVQPIVAQFLREPTPETMALLIDLANKPGRLGIVTETLKVASRIAGKANAKLGDEHVMKAITLREKMTGGESA